MGREKTPEMTLLRGQCALFWLFSGIMAGKCDWWLEGAASWICLTLLVPLSTLPQCCISFCHESEWECQLVCFVSLYQKVQFAWNCPPPPRMIINYNVHSSRGPCRGTEWDDLLRYSRCCIFTGKVREYFFGIIRGGFFIYLFFI